MGQGTPISSPFLSRDRRRVRELLEPYDTLVCLGADVLQLSMHSEVEPLPPHMAVIQLGLRDWERGKNYPASRAYVKEILDALAPLVADLAGGALRERAEAARALADRNWWAERVCGAPPAAKGRCDADRSRMADDAAVRAAAGGCHHR